MGKRNFLLGSTVAVSLFIVGCGGGDSKRKKEDKTSVVVRQVSPTNNAVNIDARSVKVEVTFNHPVDPSFFVNSSAPASVLLEKSGFKVYDMASGKPANNVSLGQLTTGKYYVGRAHGGQVVMSVPQWQFQEESNGRSSLSVTLSDTGEHFYYSADELSKAGVLSVENTSFSLTDSTGNVIPGTLAINSSSPNVVVFTALQLLKWNTRYTVRVKAGVRELNGTRVLAQDFTSQFTTANFTEPTIDNATPVGIDASPLKEISFRTNFTVSETNLNEKVRLEKVLFDEAGSETGTEPVTITAQLNVTKTNVTIKPSSELDYSTKYRVTVLGQVNGIGCVLAVTMSYNGGCLAEDFRWEFTTAAPRAEGLIPAVTNPDSPSVSPFALPAIEFNFRPNLESARSKIRVTKNNGETDVSFTANVGTTTNRIVIQPNDHFGFWDYGTKYTITVEPGVESADRQGVSTSTQAQFSFTTEHRKITSRTPGASSKEFDPDNGVIRVGFNFDPSLSQLQNRSYFAVNKQEAQDNSWVAVEGTVTYNASTRTVSFDPSGTFDFNTRFQVVVSGSLQEDCPSNCATIHEGATWEFEAINRDLTISSSTPTNNATNVRLDTPLVLNFNHPLDTSTITSYNAVSISATTISGSTSSSCTVPTVDLTYNENQIVVRPSPSWKSRCKYTFTVNNSIRGARDERISSAQTTSFSTDGLRVEAVYVTVAYGDYVDVDSELRIVFNYPLGCCATGSWVQVYDDFGRPVFGSLFRSGRELRFVPTSYLSYGMGYDVVINDDYVVGEKGEVLASNYTATFLTENLPVDVVDYGPTGEVFVDDDFWIEVWTPYNGYTNRTDDPAFPLVYGDILRDGYWDVSSDMEFFGNEIFLEPDFLLDYDTDYEIEFEFSYDYGGFYDDFTFTWDVFTELEPYDEYGAAGTNAVTKAQPARVQSKGQHKPKALRLKASCGTTKAKGCLEKISAHKAKLAQKQSIAQKKRVALELNTTDLSVEQVIGTLKPARQLKERAMAEQKLYRAQQAEKRRIERAKKQGQRKARVR